MHRLSIFIVLVVLFTACEPDKNNRNPSDIIQYVPVGTQAVLATDEPAALPEMMRSNQVISQLSNLDRFEDISDKGQFIRLFGEAKSLICLNIIGRNKPVISLLTEESLKESLDSTGLKKSAIDYTIAAYRHYSNDSLQFYAAQRNGMTMASSSELMVEEFLRRVQNNADLQTDLDLTELYNRTSGSADNSLYLQGHAMSWISQFMVNQKPTASDRTGDWYQLEPEIDADGISARGIITFKDSEQHQNRLFAGLNGGEPLTPEVIPANLTTATIFTYDDFTQLKDNLKDYRQLQDLQINRQLSTLLKTSLEAAEVASGENRYLIFRGNPESEQDPLELEGSTKTYHQVNFTKLTTSISTGILKPLLEASQYQFAMEKDGFIILGNSEKSLQNLISSFERNAVLNNSPWFISALEEVDGEAPLLKILGKSYLETLENIASAKDKNQLQKLQSSSAEGLLISSRDETGYAHVNLALPTSFDVPTKSAVKQILNINHPRQITGGPWFFKNHVTGGYDIAFQDDQNILYLFSSSGKKLWNRELDAPILGGIATVDSYKNKKYQLAFTTANQIFNIDRLGRDVGDFPVNLKGNATQGLAVFDYDRNRRYRLVSVQGDELVMYNIQGERVTGFKYEASGRLTGVPEHFRVSGKDYIVIQTDTEQGLKILNRTGGTRTQLNKNYSVSSNLVRLENELYFLDQSGKVQTINLENGNSGSSDAKYEIGSQLAVLDGQLLGLGDGELVLGDLSTPYSPSGEIRLIAGPQVAFILDSGQNQILALNNFGKKLAGFPVYGNKSLEIQKDGERLLIATLDEAGVLVYALK